MLIVDIIYLLSKIGVAITAVDVGDEWVTTSQALRIIYSKLRILSRGQCVEFDQKRSLNASIDRVIAIEIGDDVKVINLMSTHTNPWIKKYKNESYHRVSFIKRLTKPVMSAGNG